MRKSVLGALRRNRPPSRRPLDLLPAHSDHLPTPLRRKEHEPEASADAGSFLIESDPEAPQVVFPRNVEAHGRGRVVDHWGYEDPVYRFYHQSFKGYGLQELTKAIVEQLRKLLPEKELNPWFLEIVAAGTGREFRLDDNRNWPHVTRPILEAFFHARFFLDMASRYRSLETPPQILPSGYAALLYLYRIR